MPGGALRRANADVVLLVLVLYLGLIPGAVLVFSNQILCHG